MLINKTKNKVWHGRVKLADSFFKRFRGLMLKPKINYALVFILPAETRLNSSIHMFFMLQSIDVIFLDGDKRVVDVKRAKPWRIYVPKKAAKYVIETPNGVAGYLSIEIGDKIDWTIEDEKKKAVPAPIEAINKLGVKNMNSSISLAEPKPKVKER
ncbi:hypothetical protein PAP_02895 [Palaeococcus pacificus DY20341]|uniref:UPF0127 protein PAP_02895 n=1 Tax=Palaeococcus pacificus DY20341 TaxID=1343739 RepID=A0A075LRP1_9EURY|nr:DUF192 domain-containing protein [Palaeococcus pacificus]AIF68999.1 hypothetical protein PAP_02895 [Palaeococcus pacificus DY20341]